MKVFKEKSHGSLLSNENSKTPAMKVSGAKDPKNRTCSCFGRRIHLDFPSLVTSKSHRDAFLPPTCLALAAQAEIAGDFEIRGEGLHRPWGLTLMVGFVGFPVALRSFCSDCP